MRALIHSEVTRLTRLILPYPPVGWKVQRRHCLPKSLNNHLPAQLRRKQCQVELKGPSALRHLLGLQNLQILSPHH